LVLDKLDSQAAALGLERPLIIQKLRKMVPSFASLLELGIVGADEGK
jgi:hypothetical protein